MNDHRQEKYFSLISSCLLHCFLLMLCLLARHFVIQKSEQALQSDELTKQTPARVSISQKKHAIASPQARQARAMQPTKKNLVQQNPLQLKQKSPTQDKKPHPLDQKISKPAMAKQEAVLPKPKAKEQEVAKIPPKPKKIAPTIPEKPSAQPMPIFPERKTSHVSIPRSGDSRRDHAYRPGRRRRARVKGITGAQFMQAFRNIYRADQQEQAQRTPYSTYESQAQERYAYAQEHLNKLKYANYNTKVNEVLDNSFSIYNAPIYFDQDIYKQIKVTITIGSLGQVNDIRFTEPTGYKPLDDHIVSVIKKSHFAPIPKHLQCDQYTFSLAPYVNVKKGTGSVSYHYDKENEHW